MNVYIYTGASSTVAPVVHLCTFMYCKEGQEKRVRLEVWDIGGTERWFDLQ